MLRPISRLLLLAFGLGLALPAHAASQMLTLVDPEGGAGGGGGGGVQTTTQTLTILGANGPAGSTEPNTDYSKDGGVTWHPAYLFTGHPWGYISGTNAWLNQDPSPFVGLNDRVDFRIRFYLPATWTNATMTYQVNADNEADILLNGTQLVHTVGGPISSGSLATQYLVPGINTVYVRLIDYGGWVGLNYRIDLSISADSPIQLLTPPPSITSALTATGTVNSPFSYTTTATNAPTGFAASGLPTGLSINTATGVISGTPTAAGTSSVLLTASSAFGSGSNTLVLTINKAAASVVLGSLAQTYDGTVKSATATTVPAGLPVSFTYTGGSVPPVNAGNYTVFGVINHANYSGSASGTLVIAKAPVAITLGNLAENYDGSPKSVSVTTSPTGIATTVTYNGTTTAPSAVGSYAVAAQSANGNYTGSTPGTLVISDHTAPVLSLPANLTVEATSAAGAAVTFAATANDAVSGDRPVTLTPASGSTFPIGLTTVTATATDAAGNVASGTFTVKVHSLTIAVDKPTVTVDEGAIATNSGTFNDSDAVTVTVSASQGATSQTASGVWNYQQTIAVGGNPIELSLDSDENLYVANEANIFKYNAAGVLVTSWAVAGARGIAVDNVNHVVYVTANASSRIEKYSLDGVLLSTIGSPGSGDGQLSNIYCVAVDAAGNVYVTDTGHARVQVFSPSGAYLRKWGTAGSGDGQFSFNQGIRVSSAGKVYVADRNNNRIQYFDTNGNFLGKWGTAGGGDGQFNQPAGVGIDPSGNVYVGDIFNHRVQKFTATGTFVDKFGPGSGAGALNQPHGTAFADAGRSVYVASWASGVVQKYTTPGTWNWSYSAPLGSVGTSVVTATATNANGIVKSATFNLVVRDATAPTLTVPSTITLEATSPAGAVATFTATATDAVTASPTISYSQASGSTFTLGTTIVTVTATDAAGNVATQTFNVVVRDTTAPVIVPLASLVQEATGPAGAAVTFATTASDLVSGAVAVTGSPASGSVFPLGPTSVTLSATDVAGNPATATFTVTVRDTTAPVLATPANQTLEATSAAGAVATYAASATDAIGAMLSYSLASGSTFALGATTVNVTATDAAGNHSDGSFTITVRDTAAPAISAPANIVTEATSANGAAATFTASATDLVSGVVNVTSSAASGSTFPVGTTPVTLTATDAAGNVATATFSVTVTDTTAPVIAPQDNLVVEATSAQGAAVTFTPSSLDIVSGAVAVISSPASGGTFPLGPTTVTLTATDAAGNSTAKTFTVTVVDTTAPTIVTPAAIVAEATSAAGAVVTFNLAADDLVDGAVVVTAVPVSGSVFPIGTTTVTLRATDAAGNTATSTFTVTVRDTIAPVIAPLASQVLEATGPTGAVATFAATATDAVGATLSYAPAPGSVFVLGTSTVTVTAADAAANAATATFSITVRDTTIPVLALPASQTLEATGPAGAAATFSASAIDLVSGNRPVVFSANSGSTFALGATVVTATAADAAGNIAAGTFTLTVRDTTAPALTVPADLVLEATSAAGAVATYSTHAADLVDGNVTVVTSKASGGTFALGTTTVTLTATDAAHNVASGRFSVTVRDTTAPTLTVPADLVIDSASVLGAPATFTVTASDAVSGSLPVTLSKASGSTFAPGATTVTATATDAAGNVATKSFTVTVRAPAAALVNELSANNGTINGSIRQNNAAGTNFNGGGVLSGEFLVIGTPTVRQNGKPTFGGTVDGTGSTSPSGYTITLNGGASVGRIVRRMDAVALPTVAAPANPTGTRGVNLNKSTDPIGTWSTLKDLTINGSVGAIAVPAGTYGSFTANAGGGFVLGIAGSTTPTVYQFQSLTLNGNATFSIVGPVVVIMKNGLNASGAMGTGAHPDWLDLRIFGGSLTLNGTASFAGYVTAPTGTVTVNGNSQLVGGLTADKLVVNGGGTVTLLRR